MSERAVVKVVWRTNGSGDWYGSLKLAEKGGFDELKLVPGMELDFELGRDRRCTGYAPAKGERSSCPDFAAIESGDQCGACRGKDVYSGYVRGDTETALEGEFSVYLAQVGSRVKVGVTRSEKVERRWIEQGADFGVELESGLPAGEALDLENELYTDGIAQRVRKEQKLETADRKLEDVMEEHGLLGEVVDLRERTIYRESSCSNLRRSGRITGELESVKGQIISNGRLCTVMGSGRVLRNPSQKGLEEF